MTTVTSNLRLMPLLALIIAAPLAGCSQGPDITNIFGAPAPKLDTYAAAAQLGLTVMHTSRTSATLRGGDNVVVMYSDPAGEVYVNGRSLPDSGGIESGDGTLIVPGPLVRRIRAALRAVIAQGGPNEQNPGDTRPRDNIRPPGKTIGRVAIDPGHGGKDPGATSVLGTREKDMVLEVARMVAAELTAQGVEVIMTRSDDRFIELEDRPAIAARARADLFVSIHADAAANRLAAGFTAYVDHSPSKGSLAAANAILRRMCDNCSPTPSRGVKNASYRVLVGSRTPAVLIELGFLTNRAEAALLGSPGYQRSAAHAIALGICDALR
jgi:N-acetylmuramoyl-L-alanine amidase